MFYVPTTLQRRPRIKCKNRRNSNVWKLRSYNDVLRRLKRCINVLTTFRPNVYLRRADNVKNLTLSEGYSVDS